MRNSFIKGMCNHNCIKIHLHVSTWHYRYIHLQGFNDLVEFTQLYMWMQKPEMRRKDGRNCTQPTDKRMELSRKGNALIVIRFTK